MNAEITWAEGKVETLIGIHDVIGFDEWLRAAYPEGVDYLKVIVNGKTYVPREVEKVVEEFYCEGNA